MVTIVAIRAICLSSQGLETIAKPLEPQHAQEPTSRHCSVSVDAHCELNRRPRKAFFAMVHLPYLQPFEDVNKRVSRLTANIPFIRQNLSPLSFIDVPERASIEGLLGVYELNRVDLLRDVFVWAYERSAQRYVAIHQSLGEPDKFRLRFRNELIEVVNEIVRGKKESNCRRSNEGGKQPCPSGKPGRPSFV